MLLPLGARQRELVTKDLERSIEADPERGDGYLVYGDWLLERGQPRGELVSLDKQLQNEPRGDHGRELRARRRAILQEHRNELLGPLESDAIATVTVDWHLGFARKLVVSGRGGPAALSRRLRDILEHPTAKFVRTVLLGPFVNDDDNDNDNDVDVDELLPLWVITDAIEGHNLPTVNALTLGRPLDGSWPTGCSIDGVVAALPNLRELEIASNDDLAPFRCPTLTRLSLWIHRIGPRTLGSVHGSHGLEAFTVFLGDAHATASDVARVVDGLPPTVKALALRGAANTDELVLEVPLAFESLDFSMGSLSENGARTLAARVGGTLRRLDVSDCWLLETDPQILDGLCDEVLIGFQEGPSIDFFLPAGAWWLIRNRRNCGRIARHGQHFDDALVCFEAGRVAHAVGDRQGEKDAAATLASICQEAERYSECVRWRRHAVGFAPRPRDFIALSQSLNSVGRNYEPEELLVSAIGDAEDPSDIESLELELACARLHLGVNDLALLERLAKSDLATRNARVWDILGNAYVLAGRAADALSAFEKAQTLETDPSVRVSHMANIARSKGMLGRLKEAEVGYQDVIEKADELGDQREAAVARGMLGQMMVHSGRPIEAMPWLVLAVEALEELGLNNDLGQALSNLGHVRSAADDLQAARVAFSRACGLHEAAGNKMGHAGALCNLAGLHFEEEDFASCEDLARQGLAIALAGDDFWTQGTCFLMIGDVFLARLELRAAAAEFAKSVAASARVSNHRWQAWGWERLGRVAYAKGQHEEAANQYRKALDVLEPLGDDEMLGVLKTSIAALRYVAGEDAASILENARAHIERCGVHRAGRQTETVARFIEGERSTDDHYAAWLCAGVPKAAP